MVDFSSFTNGFGLSSRKVPGQTQPYSETAYGNKKDKLGRPLGFRDSHVGEFIFQTKNLQLLSKRRDIFYVDIITTEKKYEFILKNIDLPDVKMELQTLNQYNRSRHFYSKYDVGNDFVMVIYDTDSIRLNSFIVEYISFYVSNPFNSVDLNKWKNDYFNTFNNEEFGITSRTKTNYNFIERIDVYHVYNGLYTVQSLFNPKLKSFDPDKLSIEDDGIFPEITLNFVCESVSRYTAAIDLSKNKDLQEKSKLAKADVYETANRRYYGGNQLAPSWKRTKPPAPPNIFGNILNNLGQSLLNGNKTNLGNIVKNSAIDSMGYYDFYGINAGAVASSTNRTGSVLGQAGISPNITSVGWKNAILGGGLLLGGAAIGANRNNISEGEIYDDLPYTSSANPYANQEQTVTKSGNTITWDKNNNTNTQNVTTLNSGKTITWGV